MANIVSIQSRIENITSSSIFSSLPTDVIVIRGNLSGSIISLENYLKAINKDINNVLTVEHIDKSLTYQNVVSINDLREGRFTVLGGELYARSPGLVAGENLDNLNVSVNYTNHFLSTEYKGGFQIPVTNRDFVGETLSVVPSWNTSTNLWEYSFNQSSHYFSNLIPGFTVYSNQDEVLQLFLEGEPLLFLESGELGENSYKYDSSTSILSINSQDYLQWLRSPFEAVVSMQVENVLTVEASPRLIEKKDSEIRLGSRLYGKIVQSKETIELVNVDGGLNELAQDTVLGRVAFLQNINDGIIEQSYTGVVEEVEADTKKIKFEIGAIQSFLDVSFKEKTGSGKNIPLMFGKIRGFIPEIEEGTSFIITKDNYDHSNIRYLEDGDLVLESHGSFTKENELLIFDASEEVYETKIKQGISLDVVSDRANPTRNDFVAPRHVIQNMLNSFTKLRYDTRSFDTPEISSQNLGGISFLANHDSILEAFNEILRKCFLFFIYKNNGLFTIRSLEYEATTHTIDSSLIVGTPSFSKTRKEGATRVVLNYQVNHNADKKTYRRVTATNLKEGLKNLGLKKEVEFDTLYEDTDYVDDLSEFLVDRLSGNRVIVKVKLSRLPSNINMLDKVILKLQVNKHELLPNIDNYTVIGISRSNKGLTLEGFIV